MLIKYLLSLFDRAKMSAFLFYMRLKWFVVQVLTVIILVSILLWLSIFLYAAFYYIYMPSVAHERPVHFSFRADCASRDKLCSFPTANMSLLTSNNRELLAFGQSYVVKLQLEMPESYTNQKLGMFMIQLQFYTRHGEIVFTTARSTVLSYKSWLFRTLETLLFFLPSLFFRSAILKQILVVELCDNFVSDPYRPTLGALIEVQSKRVDIYNASLIIHAEFSGLRYILYNWPMISAVFGIASNFFFLSIVVLFSWLAYVTRSKDELDYLASPKDSTKDLEDSDDQYYDVKPLPDSTMLVEDILDTSDIKLLTSEDLCGPGFCRPFGDQPADEQHFDNLKHRKPQRNEH